MSNDRMTQVSSSQRDPEREQRIFTFKATQLIWLLFGILEALIGLKLIGANPDSPIVALIYGFTYLFLFHFAGLIGLPTAGSMVLEFSSMFAMMIYGLIAWALERMVWLIFYRPNGPAVATTQTTTSENRTTS
jgi:ABC-type transport system involved in multi-copper enzyme maturation permease subunit